MKIIKYCETNQCQVSVYATDYMIKGKIVYCVISNHKSNGKELVRFGTFEQVQQILNTYHVEKGF